MSSDSRVALGLLLAAALVVVLIVDTFPRRWRSWLLVFVGAAFALILAMGVRL